MTILTTEEFTALYVELPDERKARISGVIQHGGPGGGPSETPYADAADAGPAYEAAEERAREVVSRRLTNNPPA